MSETAAIPPEVVAFTHAVLLDGRLIGHWRPQRKSKWVIVETSLNGPLARQEAQALGHAAERYGRFLGVPATLA